MQYEIQIQQARHGWNFKVVRTTTGPDHDVLPMTAKTPWRWRPNRSWAERSARAEADRWMVEQRRIDNREIFHLSA